MKTSKAQLDWREGRRRGGHRSSGSGPTASPDARLWNYCRSL